MPNRILAATITLALLAIYGPAIAWAGERTAYTKEKLAAAQEAGKSIIVDVHASWCSTCKQQKAVLDELGTLDAYKDLVVLEINFDTQKDEWKALGVQTRSTLIAYKGDKETGRLTADTKKESIEALIKSTM